ncbi:MAG: outer membrane beta-barrel protein [Pseudomonadota bacterium]
MFKKILTTTVLGVSALGVMAANAAAPGVYVTGQLGYANTHMKGKTEAYNTPNRPGPAGTNLNNNGLAGRLAVGYQFNQNLALELGYLQLKNGKYFEEAYAFPTGTEKLKQNAIDIAAKGILPLSDRFNIYGKLGIAYLTSNITFKDVDSDSKASGNNNQIYNIAKHKWAPEAAVGVSYDITQNVSVDTSWTHIQPIGNKRPGNIDFVAVGIGYNFG